MLADRRLYITARGMLVSESDPAAAYLLAGKGQEIPAEVVKRLGLRLAEGKVAQGPEPEVVESHDVPAASPEDASEDQPAPVVPPESRRSRKRY
jgi:hypothetical protein